MKSILKSINYSSILINWISTAIYCKTVQFSTVNQIQLATVHLNYINLLVTVSSSDMNGVVQRDSTKDNIEPIIYTIYSGCGQ